jgi:iron complex transport system permease protein
MLLAALVIGSVTALLVDARRLNLLAFGEETARSLGVDVPRVRRRVFVVTSLAVAASVAVAGPIAFVGLFTPHAARFLVGSDHRVLLPASFCAGAAFLPLADALARVALAPRELPVGVVTALVGAPTFVILLSRHRARSGGDA